MDCNTGKWNTWYAGLTEREPYGDIASYQAAADWLAPCHTIGDWGCGKGWFETWVKPPRRYFGFDGSITPFAHYVVDLTAHQYVTDGVLLRHVLEHDWQWAQILTNAAASFAHRMIVVLFTPVLQPPDTVRCVSVQDMGAGRTVPNLSFNPQTLIDTVGAELHAGTDTLTTATQFGVETLLRFER